MSEPAGICWKDRDEETTTLEDAVILKTLSSVIGLSLLEKMLREEQSRDGTCPGHRLST
jgi:hypothetical protein